jgi:uncharacterized membrane protein
VQVPRLHKIFYFLAPQGQRKYFLQANDNPLPLWESCVIFKKITTKQDSVYSTTNSFVSFSSFLFFLSVSNLFQANFIYFFSLRLSTFYSFTLHIFCQPQKFSGTIGPVVRHIIPESHLTYCK